MKYIRIFFTLVIVMTAIVACRDESTYPVNFDKIANSNGAYLRQISLLSGSFNIDNLAGSEYKIILEAYDGKRGKEFTSVDFFVTFVDNTPGNGTIEEPETLVKNVPSSAFTVDAESGLPRATITITAAETATALGISLANVAGTDQFIYRQAINLPDGRSYSTDNTSADVLGGAYYNSPFRNVVSVVCPSDLEATYDGHTDWVDYYGDPGSQDYEVALVLAEDDDGNPIPGNYVLPDLSGGMEPVIWGNPEVEAVIEEVCGLITLKSAPYFYGYFILEGSNVDPDTGVITIIWENAYGEGGTTVLTPQ